MISYGPRDPVAFATTFSPTGKFSPNLSKTGFSWGGVSAADLEERTIWIVDAHGYGKQFIIRADQMPTASVELEKAIHEFAVNLIS